jgi:zona occludens toxin
MAIQAYTGLPGSGKSYGVVENVILPALKAGRRVETNIPLNLDLFAELGFAPPRIFSNDDIIDNPDFFQDTFQAGATIVIDEAWRFWPSGMKATNMLEGHKSFFAEHRHMVGEDAQSTEIILCTQDLGQIASNVRSLVEFTYRSVKLNAVGLSKKFRIDIYQGAVSGPKPPVSQRLRQIGGSYKPEIYRLYKSQTMSETNEHGNEAISDKRTNILNSKFLLIGIPIIFSLVFAFIYYSFGEVAESYGYGDDDQTVDQVPGLSSNSQSHVLPGKVSAPEIKKADKTRVLMQSTKFTIVYNNGTFPYLDYVFSLETEKQHARMTLSQLRKFGFQVLPLAPCLVQISNTENTTYARCASIRSEDMPVDSGAALISQIAS